MKESLFNFQISFSFCKWGCLWPFDENMKKIQVYSSLSFIDFIASDTDPDNFEHSSLPQLLFIQWPYCISPWNSSSVKLLVQYCFHNNLQQLSHDWNMYFWLSTSQTGSFKRSVTYGSFSIAFTKKMHILIVYAWAHVSRCVSSSHNMVWHTIAKSRYTNLCFWMFLTKNFKSFT